MPDPSAVPAAPCAKQADAGLDRLLTDVMSARSAMVDELRTRPVDARRQTDARKALLASLEAYTSALASRGLAPPPRLRDELALQRRLAGGR